MITMFKIGDTVEVVCLGTLDLESRPWLEMEDSQIKIGDKFKISFMANGWIKFDTLRYRHHPGHFKLVETTLPSPGAVTTDQSNTPALVTPHEKHRCQCEFRDLMMNGCQCGGI